MSFLDYILAGFGVYEIKDEIDIKPSFHKAKTKPKQSFVSTKEVQNSPVFESFSHKMAIFCPKTSQEVVKVAKFLAENQPVLVDVSNLEESVFQRSLDFLVGAKTALGATMKRLENGLFVMLPSGTQLVEFLEEEK